MSFVTATSSNSQVELCVDYTSKLPEFSWNVLGDLVDISENRNLKIDNLLKKNNLSRGSASGAGNNCLLNTIFQQIISHLQNPNFDDFVSFIRNRIDAKKGEWLSINDDAQGIQIVSAIQTYLYVKTGRQYYFDLTVLIADKEGDIGFIDMQSVTNIQSKLGDCIPIKMIVINYDHYEPLFILGLDINPLAKETDMTHSSTSIASTSEHRYQKVCQELTELDISGESKEEKEYYTHASEYAAQRVFQKEQLELKLALNLSTEQQARLVKYFLTLEGKSISIKGKTTDKLDITEDGIGFLGVKLQHWYEHPCVRVWILVVSRALEDKDVELAQAVLHHLHELDVDSYFLQKGEEYEKTKEWAKAKNFYHALTLMHPFESYFYLKYLTVLTNLGSDEAFLGVCKKALKYVTDPVGRKFIQYKWVAYLPFSRNKTLPSIDAVINVTKILSEIFGLKTFDKKTLPVDYLEYLRKQFYHFTHVVPLPEEKKEKEQVINKQIHLYGLALKLINSCDQSNRIILDYQRQFVEEYMNLVCMDGTTYDGGSPKFVIFKLLLNYHRYPNVQIMSVNWCLKNDCLADLIEFYNGLENNSDSMKSNHYFAKGFLCLERGNPKEALDNFKKSYEYDPSPAAAFNQASLLLIANKSRNAETYIKFAIEALHKRGECSQNPECFLLLWMSQLLGGNLTDASSTLDSLEEYCYDAPNIYNTICDCRKRQNEGSPYLYDELMECAGLIPKKKNKQTESVETSSSSKHVVPDEIKNWIKSKKVDLINGFVGVPLSQTNVNQLPSDRKERYSQELRKKLKNNVVRLPMTKHDCWIGKAGSPIPRIDIEQYYPHGNAPHFQRFRFQEGSTYTYGGLWLPIDTDLAEELILKASYQEWTKLGSAYLVVFDLSFYGNLGEIFLEIYMMHVHHRKNKLLGKRNPKPG